MLAPSNPPRARPLGLDLAHLGLDPDCHTGSLVPGDPDLGVTDSDVALTGKYQGRRRMTPTYPAIDRDRRVLRLVTGAGKGGMLAQSKVADSRHGLRPMRLLLAEYRGAMLNSESERTYVQMRRTERVMMVESCGRSRGNHVLHRNYLAR